MKKNLTLCVVSLLITTNVIGQSLTTMTEYYDYFRTRVKRVYTVLPNDKKHGTEKCYLQTGAHFCTNTYQNGERTAVKVFFTDGSIKVDAKIAPGSTALNGFCSEYSLYAISNNGKRILGMHSKLHKAQSFDKLEDFSHTIMRDRWDIELGDWRIESYQQNYLDGKPRIRFTTSADKKTEHFISYDENGAVNDDIVYDIASESLIINALVSSDYVVKDGILTFYSDGDKIITHGDLEYKIPNGTQIKIDNKITVNRKEYYNMLLNCNKDEDTGEFAMTVSENGLNSLLSEDVLVKNIKIEQLEFLGRRLKWSAWNPGICNLDILLQPKVVGNIGDGIYFAKNSGWEIEATYESWQLSYLHIQQGDNYIKGKITNNLLNGEGEYVLGDESYKGLFLNNNKSGKGYLKTSDYTYEGELENNTLMGQGKKVYTRFINKAKITEEGVFNNTLIRGVRIMEYADFTLQYNIVNENEDGGRVIWKNGDYYVGEDLKYFDGEGKIHYVNGDYFDGYITKIFDYVRNSRSREKDTKYRSGGYEYETPEIGRFEQGKIRITLESGIIYEGDYDKGFKGNGKLILVNGDELSGEFTENQLNYLQPINVKLKLPTGDVFEGVYAAGKFNGKGKITKSNGEVVEGTFKNGKMTENPKVKLPIKKIVIPSVDFDITQY